MDKKELVNFLKDMSDEEVLALIHESRNPETGYERAGYEEIYYYEQCGMINDTEEEGYDYNKNQYKSGNYYTYYQVAINNIRADNLTRNLRRFAAEHGGCVPPSANIDVYSICYNYTDESFNVQCCNHTNTDYYLVGEPLFVSEEAAQAAIDKYADELNWYFTEYNPMPEGWEYNRT